MKQLSLFPMFLFVMLSMPTSSFAIGPYTDNQNGTVRDTGTGLTWMQDTVDTDGSGSITFNDGVTWQEALDWCESSSLAGGGWRLPNSRELLSIIDDSTSLPAIDPVFTTLSGYYWSATTYASNTAYAWLVYFRYGNVVGFSKTEPFHVRCVRSGATGPVDLSVIWAGSGSGSIHFDPPDENCSSDCSKSYSSGASVALSATADSGSLFSGWSGAGCSGITPCTVTMDETKSVTATFEPDQDGDGVSDSIDNCPLAVNPGQEDSDGDDVGNVCDNCPTDPDKTEPGQCGCGVSDTDSDSDGTPDCNDNCSTDPNKTEPGQCGCGVAETDSDSDGTADCNDTCPDDPNKIEPGTCGCGVSDTDSDSDGTSNCNDNCPDDPNKYLPNDECGYVLSITLSGKGRGSVSSEPAGISCFADCEERYGYKELVTLRAAAQGSSQFAGWSGDCSGNADTCEITVDEVKNVGAEFYKFPWPMFLPALSGNRP